MGKNWSWLTSLSSFFRKKKLEEEEAEVKRKATDAAYQGKLSPVPLLALDHKVLHANDS